MQGHYKSHAFHMCVLGKLQAGQAGKGARCAHVQLNAQLPAWQDLDSRLDNQQYRGVSSGHLHVTVSQRVGGP
jgi:hypothetical protein